MIPVGTFSVGRKEGVAGGVAGIAGLGTVSDSDAGRDDTFCGRGRVRVGVSGIPAGCVVGVATGTLSFLCGAVDVKSEVEERFVWDLHFMAGTS